MIILPWSNAFWPGLTPFGPPMWQAEADTELTLSASPDTEGGQILLYDDGILLEYGSILECIFRFRKIPPPFYVMKFKPNGFVVAETLNDSCNF